MELLSPLLVLRVQYGLATLFWPLVWLVWRWSGLRDWMILAGFVLTLAVWIVLVTVRTVDIRWSKVLVAVWIADASLLVWAGHGTATGFSALYCLMGVFVALFFSGPTVITYVIVSALTLWLALLGPIGPGAAATTAALVAISGSAVTAAVCLLTRSARRHGTIDLDTGLPNGLGLTLGYAGRDPHARVVLAAVLVSGIDQARVALGYPVGSELVRKVVESIGRVVPVHAVMARLEGDTLVVARQLDRAVEREDVTNDALVLARAICGAIASDRFVIGGVEVMLRASVGIAFGPWDGSDVPELVRRAVVVARRAETAGRLWMLWEGDHDTLTTEDVALLTDLSAASDRGELSLVYQPQVDPRSGRIAAVEALLRWSSPVHGDVAPERFVVLAERTGLIDRLTGWALSEALDAQVRWHAHQIHAPVSVNLSAKTLTRPDLVEWILHELGVRQLSPSCLALELTETAAADLPQAVLRLGRLRERGIRISIDDFGTGHTSLAALAELPVDELKIDRGFVQRSSSSPADEAIVRTFSELAHRLGLVAVAEGVEDEPTRMRLDDFGFDLVQGFHLAAPLPERDLIVLLEDLRDPTAAQAAR
jgi:EAL domain-containing protein (putative c-di-GMP-specific phosphodiesterase class I)/GGDEF domain-containing protein